MHPHEGALTDADPEWNPEDSHNDRKAREHLYDMAGMRKDALLTDFESITGFEYWAFWYARSRVLDVHEPDLKMWDLCGLGVAGYPEWTSCKECGTVGPPAVFLQVELERRDGRRQVCDRCVDRKTKCDGVPQYTEENMATARDERA